MPITTFDPEKPGDGDNHEKQITAPQSHAGPLGFVDDSDASGEITAEDIKFPRLAVVHKIGELSELFPGKAGSFVLNKDGILCPPGEALDVTAVFAKKYYEEDVGFDSGTFGKRVSSAQEVLNNGGSLMRGDDNYYAPVADILFLVKKPEKVDPAFEGMFFYDVAGAPHLLAVFTARSTAYNGVAVPIWTLKQQRGSVRASHWKLSTFLNSYNNKSWHKPILRPAGQTEQAYLDFMNGLSF